MGDLLCPYRKINKGYHSYIKFVELDSLMFHVMFQNRPFGSEVEGFQRFLLFIAMAAIWGL